MQITIRVGREALMRKSPSFFKGLIFYKSTSNPLTNIPGFVLKT